MINAMSKNKSEKGLVLESFDWDEESLSSEDEGVTKVKAFIAIAEDEPTVGKANTRKRTINQAAAGKLRGKNAEESRALLEDLALYDNESWNDPRGFANRSRQSLCVKMSRVHPLVVSLSLKNSSNASWKLILLLINPFK
ncbi:hypothetical protein Tco_0490284 [Tanacetum coccineum]